MTKFRRKVYLGGLGVAMGERAVPIIGVKVRASGGARVAKPIAATTATGLVGPAAPMETLSGAPQSGQTSSGPVGKKSAKTLEKMGITLLHGTSGNSVTQQSIAIGKQAAARMAAKQSKKQRPQSAEPVNMAAASALSTALIPDEGGRGTQFDEVLTLAVWNGQEQYSANHSGVVDNFDGKIPTGPTGPASFQLTRAAISEHTIANGFPEDIFYYGDSFGNVYVNATTNLSTATGSGNVFVINLPTVLNAFGDLNSDDQIVVTGLAVSPVVDLSSFANVNGDFASFSNLIGEVLYVTFTDTESGFNVILPPGSPPSLGGTLVRSGLLAFPVADIISGASVPPGILTPAGYPVQVGGAFGVAFSVFDNEAGVAVDDDGSAYFQQVDLINGTGANIIKVTSTDDPVQSPGNTGYQDRSLATDGFEIITSLFEFDPPPAGGGPGIADGPVDETIDDVQVTQINTFTDYSGGANLFGNIEAIAAGPCNNLYAAVARSGEPGDPESLQIAEGPYSTGGTALGATPTMVIRFS